MRRKKLKYWCIYEVMEFLHQFLFSKNMQKFQSPSTSRTFLSEGNFIEKCSFQTGFNSSVLVSLFQSSSPSHLNVTNGSLEWINRHSRTFKSSAKNNKSDFWFLYDFYRRLIFDHWLSSLGPPYINFLG